MSGVWHGRGGAPRASSAVSSQVWRGLTLLSWRGQKRALQDARQIRRTLFVCQKSRACHQKPLGRSGSMLPLCLLKGGRLIAAALGPHRKDDTNPDIGQSTDSDRMAFAFSTFSLIIVSGPGFTLRRLP